MTHQVIVALLFMLSLYGIGALILKGGNNWEKFLTGGGITIIYIFILVHSNNLTLPLLSLPFLGSVAGGFLFVREMEITSLLRHRRLYIFILLLIPPLLIALTPPHRLFDPQYYQLAIPQWYVIKEGFYWDRFFQPSLFAAAGNMLYIPMLAWGSDIGPQLLTLFSLYLTLIIFSRILEEYLEEATIIPAIIFALTPFVYFLAPFGYNGFIQTLYFAGGVYQLFRLNKSGDRRTTTIILAALFLGIAGSTKYQGLILFGFVTMWALLLLPRKRDVILVAFLSTLLIAPWYIRNWIVSGNPMWPFLNSLFGLPHPERVDIVQTTLEGKKHSLIAYPMRIVLWNFLKPLRGIQSIAGPLYLALLPWSLSGIRRSRVIRKSWVILLSFFPFAYIMMGNPRYYMVIHLLMAYLSWHGLKIWREHFKPAMVVAILVLILQASIVSAEVVKSAKYIFSRQTPRQFLQANEESYQLSSFTNYIPRKTPVIILNWQKIFYLRRLTVAVKGKDEPETWKKLKELSYRYGTRWLVTPYPFIVTCTPFAPVCDTPNFTLWFRGIEHSSPSQENAR